MKLLIVDDSSVIRSRIARQASHPALSSLHIAGLAKNGAEALTLYALHRPQLITMDLTMPEMDGLETIDAIIKINPSARILVVSALADRATAIRALKLGALGFLLKPFTDEQLVSSLLELMSDA